MSVVSKDKVGLDKKRLRNSFRYAFSGIIQAYQEEQNLRFHTCSVIIVIIFGFLFKISMLEFIICLILIGLVLMAEFFNTAIENVVDLVTDDIHPLAKKAKDIAAAGVLMMAFISTIIGLIIFVPYIIEFIKGVM